MRTLQGGEGGVIMALVYPRQRGSRRVIIGRSQLQQLIHHIYCDTVYSPIPFDPPRPTSQPAS